MNRGVRKKTSIPPAAEPDAALEHQLFQVFLEAHGCLLIAFTHEGEILLFNRTCEELTGYTADEARGRMIWDFLLAPEDVPRVREALAPLKPGHNSASYETTLLTREGERKWIVWSTVAVVGEGKGSSRVVAIGIDRSHHRRTQELIQHEEKRLNLIFNAAVEGIISIDERGCIEIFNPAAEKLFGYTAAEVIGRNINILMPGPYQAEHDRYLQNYLETGQAKIIGIGREVTGLRKNGTTFPMHLSVSESRIGGRHLFTGFVQDLTERKQHEEAIRSWSQELERRVEQRTRELQLANQELEHFAFAISHDLRTPLRGIRNYVDFLTEDLKGKIEAESAEDLNRLGRATEELDRMIEELLQYSRIGRINSDPERVNLKSLILEISKIVSTRPDREVVIDGEMPSIVAPLSILRQIFQNLIENGIHYNQSGTKRVRIAAHRIEGPDPRWRFDFEDNGIGIDPRYHEKIFGMFERLHSDKEFSGTGIGLAAVRKSVQFLGGTIRVTSSPGDGSIFSVELPEVAPQAGAGI